MGMDSKKTSFNFVNTFASFKQVLNNLHTQISAMRDVDIIMSGSVYATDNTKWTN